MVNGRPNSLALSVPRVCSIPSAKQNSRQKLGRAVPAAVRLLSKGVMGKFELVILCHPKKITFHQGDKIWHGN